MKQFMVVLLFVIFGTYAGVLGYWAQDRRVPARQLAMAEYVPPVHPGGKLLVKFIVERDRVCSSVRQDQIIDSHGVTWLLPARASIVSPGPLHQRDVRITQTDISEDMPLGAAKLRVTISYTCNPLHMLWPVIDQFPDIDFTVSPPRKIGD